MYSVIKSKKVQLQNYRETALLFCCFLNNERVIAVFENKDYAIIDVSQNQQQTKLIFQDRISTQQAILDCKRIKQNVCVIITRRLAIMSIIKYISDDEILMKQVYLQEGDSFNDINMFIECVPFTSQCFVIKNQVFQDKTVHFMVITSETEQLKFELTILSHEMEQSNNNYNIIKPLTAGKQFVFFKQNRGEQQTDWKISFMSIQNKYNQKIIHLQQQLTDQHIIMDLILKQKQQYYIFTKRKLQLTQEQIIQVYRCRMYANSGHYIQSLQKMIHYNFTTINMTQIIDINYFLKYMVIKSLSHCQSNNEIMDNTLQIINLQTGESLIKYYCNIKNIDISPNHSYILEYSQQINQQEEIFMHIRSILDKKIIYHHLIKQSPIIQQFNLNYQLRQEILSLL